MNEYRETTQVKVDRHRLVAVCLTVKVTLHRVRVWVR